MKYRSDVLVVCSPGGHLLQMLAVEDAWSGLDVQWVTFHAPDSDWLLREERVWWAYFPTHRNAKNFIRNLGFAVRVLNRTRPRTVISTGAALAVPFFVIGKMSGASLVYIESLTRVNGLSLTGKIVKPLADDFFVQWPALVRGKTRYVGRVT